MEPGGDTAGFPRRWLGKRGRAFFPTPSPGLLREPSRLPAPHCPALPRPVCRDQRKPLPFPWTGHKPKCLNHTRIKIYSSSRNRNAAHARHRLLLAPGPQPGVTPALASAERKQLLENKPVRTALGCPFSPGCRRQDTWNSRNCRFLTIPPFITRSV